jgi:L-asparaginase
MIHLAIEECPLKRIYIFNTGGTIGMRRTEKGYAPEKGYLAEQLARLPELASPEMPQFTLQEHDTLLDSANMTPHDWVGIARELSQNYDDYDGFVVLHGTDTMAYSASALAYMLDGLTKPVILTGSQIPLCEIRSDARSNLITAMMLAADYPVPEVMLYFGNVLLRGCRAVKVHADGFEAFDSPNYPPLGRVGIDIDINEARIRTAAEGSPGPLRVQEISDQAVAALRIFPGISADLIRKVTQPPLRGLVIEAYGVGNAPVNQPDLLDAIREATKRGVVVVDCTQCLRGRVDLGDYATGSALARTGVISGADMTVEAALTKLYYLFSSGHDAETVKAKMGENLRGELTAL